MEKARNEDLLYNAYRKAVAFKTSSLTVQLDSVFNWMVLSR